MDYARHQAELSRPGPDGVPQGETWLEAARRGNAHARKRLEGPPFPEDLAHVWKWAQELYGRSGINMAGLNPLSYESLLAWAVLTDQWPEPHEIEALLAVDSVLRAPEAKKADASKKEAGTVAPWPTKGNTHG